MNGEFDKLLNWETWINLLVDEQHLNSPSCFSNNCKLNPRRLLWCLYNIHGCLPAQKRWIMKLFWDVSCGIPNRTLFCFSFFMCRDDSSILFSTFVCVCKTLCVQSYLFDPAKPHFVPVGLDTRNSTKCHFEFKSNKHNYSSRNWQIMPLFKNDFYITSGTE